MNHTASSGCQRGMVSGPPNHICFLGAENALGLFFSTIKSSGGRVLLWVNPSFPLFQCRADLSLVRLISLTTTAFLLAHSLAIILSFLRAPFLPKLPFVFLSYLLLFIINMHESLIITMPQSQYHDVILPLPKKKKNLLH